MKTRNYTEKEKIIILLEHESGIAVKDICEKYHISLSTFYKWRRKSILYIQMFRSERLQFIEENNRLRELLDAQNKYIEELLQEIILKKFST
jgi:putative transposase